MGWAVRPSITWPPRGVGTIAVADGDRVELSNLQRQILHTVDDIGRLKTRSAVEKLRRLNGDIMLKPLGITLNARNGEGIINGFDFVVEASDNFETKFLVNDLCLRAWGSVQPRRYFRPGRPGHDGLARSICLLPMRVRATASPKPDPHNS